MPPLFSYNSSVYMGGSRGGGVGGTGGSVPALKNYKNIGFHSNTGPAGSPEKSQDYQARIQCWAIIGMPAKRHLNGILLAGRCMPAFGGIWILSLKKTLSKLDPL